jgi:hypothetical protein
MTTTATTRAAALFASVLISFVTVAAAAGYAYPAQPTALLAAAAR